MTIRKNTYFFDSSNVAHHSISELHALSWSTYAALLDFKNRISDFIARSPDAPTSIINQQFTPSSPYNVGDLKHQVYDIPWPIQEHHLASSLLIHLTALFEAWAEDILAEVNVPKAKIESWRKALQLNSAATSSNTFGIADVLQKCVARKSAVMTTHVYPAYVAEQRRYSLANLENLVYCYQHFKTIRNSIIHHAGITNLFAVSKKNAYQAAFNTCSLADLGFPEPIDIIDGGTPLLTVYSVVNLSDILMRLIATVDVELTQGVGAEQILMERMQVELRNANVQQMGDPNYKERIYIGLFKKAGLRPSMRQGKSMYDVVDAVLRGGGTA